MNVYHVRYSADMRLFSSEIEWTVVLAENERIAEKSAIEKIKTKWKRQYKYLTGNDLIIHSIDIDIWGIQLLLENYKQSKGVA